VPPVTTQPIREMPKPASEITVILDASGSPSSRLKGSVVAELEDGWKIQVTTAIGSGLLVSLTGHLETPDGRQPIMGKYRVRSCRLAGIGKYNAELVREIAKEEPGQAATSESDDADYYEILQVSRTADFDTIRRVFHVLAQRYHPDNKQTGNDEKFRQVVESHATLSDPEKRAAHDVKLAQEDKTRHRIFDSLENTQGVQAEVRKRKGILRLLYAKRLADAHDPGMRARDFVEMLGCPMEHLEFAMWFLRESKFILRSDNNHFEITRVGVEAFEAEDANYGKKQLLKLAAPNQPAESD